MKKIILCLLLLSVLAFTSCADSGNDILDPLKAAPDFTVYDLEGNEVKLSDFKGKPVVINFWASWCPPCKAELPDFEKAYKENPDVVFLMVNLTDGYQETLEKASGFVKDNGYTFPVYYDTDMDAAKVYGISSIPMTNFVKANGEQAFSHVGLMNYETLTNCIKQITE